jgi:2-polyprenyl-3-methyl-5-hydroxy-6-metoxy-1,4-benzoquinol methylase
LDVGGGDGSFIDEAGKLGWSATAVERNPAPLLAHGLSVVQDLKEAGGLAPFDAITLWHSLEHFEDLEHVIAPLKNLLARNGKLLIAVPRARSLQAKLTGKTWIHLDVPRHLHHFSDRSLQQVLARHSFLVQSVMRHEFEYDLMGWVQSLSNRVMKSPNLFFQMVTGHAPKGKGVLERAAAFLLGGCLTLIFLPVTVVECLLNRSGTLVVIANRDQGVVN